MTVDWKVVITRPFLEGDMGSNSTLAERLEELARREQDDYHRLRLMAALKLLRDLDRSENDPLH